MSHDKNETITVSLTRTRSMWTGTLKNKTLNLFNLRHPSIQANLNVKNPAGRTGERAAICVFNCENPNRLDGGDQSLLFCRASRIRRISGS
jgi:hypothetical protein